MQRSRKHRWNLSLQTWHCLHAFAIRSLALALIRNMRRPEVMDDNQDHGIDPHSDECLISYTFLSSSTHDRNLHLDFATNLHSKHRSTNAFNWIQFSGHVITTMTMTITSHYTMHNEPDSHNVVHSYTLTLRRMGARI